DVSGVNAMHEGAPPQYENLEEFTAVVIANVYYAEVVGAMPATLLGGHGGPILPPMLKDSPVFYNRYRQHMQDLTDNHPEFVKKLKVATGIAHNPFVYFDV